MLNLLYADVNALPGGGPTRFYQLVAVFDANIERVTSDVYDVIMSLPGVAERGCGVEGNTLRLAGCFTDPVQTLRFVLEAFKIRAGLNPETRPCFITMETDRVVHGERKTADTT